jgi:hypothetical protein
MVEDLGEPVSCESPSADVEATHTCAASVAELGEAIEEAEGWSPESDTFRLADARLTPPCRSPGFVHRSKDTSRARARCDDSARPRRQLGEPTQTQRDAEHREPEAALQ